MGATTSKSDDLYKKISKRTRQTNIQAINIKQSDESIKEDSRRQRRATRKAKLEEKKSHTRSMTEDLDSVPESPISPPKQASKGLACFVESPDIEERSSSASLSEKISLHRKDSQMLVSQDNFAQSYTDKPSTSKDIPSSSSDIDQESEQVTQIRAFKLSNETSDFDRDCDSKAVLTGSLLDFGRVSSSEDEEEEMSRKKTGMMVGNWTGTKKTLGKKIMKKLDKKKGKASQCPVLRSSDHISANVFLTEDIDDDLEVLTDLPLNDECVKQPEILTPRSKKKKDTTSQLSDLKGKVVSVIKKPSPPKNGGKDNLGFDPDEVIDISCRKKSTSMRDSHGLAPKNKIKDKTADQGAPSRIQKKKIVSKGLSEKSDVQECTYVRPFAEMTEVESLSSVSQNLIESIPTIISSKKHHKQPKKHNDPRVKQDCLPGMYKRYSDSSDSSDEDNNSLPQNKNLRKLRGGIKSGWMENENYRCDSPGTAMRKMKEDGIIPKVRDIDHAREDARQRKLMELEELGIVSGKNGSTGHKSDSANSGLHRPRPPKLAPMNLHIPDDDDY